MNKGRRRPGKMQKLFDKGGHWEMKSGPKLLSVKKHSIVFSPQSGLVWLVHYLKVNGIGDLAVDSQFPHCQGRDDMACITCPSHGPSFADGLTGGSFFLTSRHSTNRSEGGERASISPKSYTKKKKKKKDKITKTRHKPPMPNKP